MACSPYGVVYFRNADTRGNLPRATSDPDAEGGPPEEGRVGHPRLWECAAFEDRVLAYWAIKLRRDAKTPFWTLSRFNPRGTRAPCIDLPTDAGRHTARGHTQTPRAQALAAALSSPLSRPTTSTHPHHPGIKRKAPTAKEGNDKATKDKVQALRVGEIVHVPHSVFPREKKPRGGYWVGKVCATKEGGAADVGIHIKDEPIFTRPALEVAQWRVQK